jgi:hypothetical protein
MGIVFAIVSNARSTSWHDGLTNKRRRAMEEFIIIKRLHIANEQSCYTKFQTSRGASNIDLTVINNTAINYPQEWFVYDGEICSDHNIIKYTLRNYVVGAAEKNNTDTRYIVTAKNMETFQEAVIRRMRQIALEMGMEGKGEDELDEILCQRATATPNIEVAVDKLQTVLDYACRSSFRQTRLTSRNEPRHKSVPWWNSRLTLQIKEVNAKRRRYRRTKDNPEQREQRKVQYLVSKAEYAAAIRREKIKSWKEFCN